MAEPVISPAAATATQKTASLRLAQPAPTCANPSMVTIRGKQTWHKPLEDGTEYTPSQHDSRVITAGAAVTIIARRKKGQTDFSPRRYPAYRGPCLPSYL